MKDQPEIGDLGIVLGSVNHGDGTSVLRLFSRTHGVIGCWMREGKRGGRRSNRLFAPLTVLGIPDLKGKPGGLFRFQKAERPWVQLRTSAEMNRAAVAMFLAEFVDKILASEVAHPEVFDALMRAAHVLEHEEKTAWVHLAFSVELTALLGLKPESVPPPSGAKRFDLLAVEWQFDPPVEDAHLDLELGQLFTRIQGMNIDNILELKIDKDQRVRLLRAHVSYLQIHLSRRAPIKSWDVLHDVLSS